jgi:hypothetical protein
MNARDEAGYDVLVIGAGLAGLVAGLSLQRGGKRVLIIDKRGQAGGLCGTFGLHEHDFVIACNDFGSGLVDMLHELGVDIQFEHKKSFVYYKGEFLNIYPDFDTLWKLRRNWQQIIGGLLAVGRRVIRRADPQSLEDFVDQHFPPGRVNDLVKAMSYFMGVGPYDMQVSFFGLDRKYAYGYTKMACPIGGPQKMVDAIVEQFVRNGGTIQLQTEYKSHSKDGDIYADVVKDGKAQAIKARYLVNATEYRHGYAEDVKRGIPLSMMVMVIDDAYAYPKDIHTFFYCEPDISSWFKKLDHGETAERFGFHIFKSDLVQQTSGYTMNAYFYLPRGKNTLTIKEMEFYRRYLLAGIEEMLPGIGKSVQFAQIIPPDDFRKMHGLSSRVMPFICGGDKPGNIGDDPNVFYAGHTVYPPGDHAGAAALSGHLVAKLILESKDLHD